MFSDLASAFASGRAVRRAITVAVVILVGVAALACTPSICSRVSDCAAGLTCTTAGQCIIPPDAAPTNDGGGIIDASDTTIIGDAPADAPDLVDADLGGL